MGLARVGRLLAWAAAGLGACCAAQAASTVAVPPQPGVEASVSADVRQVTHWVMESGDNGGLPFAVVDKKAAQLVVLTSAGRVLGATSALVGEAVGDHTVPGVGDKQPSQVLPHERTTPAGRFFSEPGSNLTGEHVVWVDYDSGFAIHRLRPGASLEHRTQRLSTPTPDDNRASLGCVVVPASFYEAVVMPVLGGQRAVVYVLPETQPLSSMIGPGASRLVLQQPPASKLR